MRITLSMVALLTLSACASEPQVEQARMPLNIVRARGEAPRMGDVRLEAGSHEDNAPFSFSITFAVEGRTLTGPKNVGWTSKFGDYCRDHGSWLQTVLVGPDGQEWRGQRVFVPAGPDRGQDWSTGSTGSTGPGAVATPGLMDAADTGGRFTVALEDEQGRRWPQGVFDTPAAPERQRLFETNLKAFAAVDPAKTPVRSDMLLVVERDPFVQPNPPRPCPVS